MSDIYTEVTELLVKELEAGNVPWHRPWKACGPANLISGKEYRGINLFILLFFPKGDSRYWLTFKQANGLGGHVRRGEKGTRVYYFNLIDKDELDDKGRPVKIPIWKSYVVFNASQCEGLKHKRLADEAPETPEPAIAGYGDAEALLFGWKDCPKIDRNGQLAVYRPTTDAIEVPSADKFESIAEFYSTLFHEVIHSTGHKSRLAREGIVGQNSFRSHEYSKEELVAEFGAAFLCNLVGVSTDDSNKNSAAYLRGWAKRLREEKRWVVQAASAAQAAADYVQNKKAKREEEAA